jgi:flagellar biosynthetic protein FliR
MLTTATIAAFALYLLRTGALLLSAPIFSTGSSFSGYRVALVTSITFLMFGATGHALVVDVTPMMFLIMALREVAIGLAMAFVLTLLQLVARMSGDMIGQGMGLAMSNQSDPVTGIQTPLVARIYEVIFVLGFLAMNGHHVLLRALGDSFGRAPVGAIGIGGSLPELITQFFGAAIEAGVTFAAPVMVMLLLLSVLIGVLARVVPQINVLEMSFSLRVALALVAMFVFAPVLSPSLMRLYDMQSVWLDQLIGSVQAAEVIHG